MTTAFRFDPIEHAYYFEDQRVPSITQMLDLAGLIDDRWYTEESSTRGTAVHELATKYDLGALDPAECSSKYRGYLLGYVAAVTLLRPTWHGIEIPSVHPTYRFGGRPDRWGLLYRLRSIVEIKTGVREKAHAIQTALQAILISADAPLPAEQWNRMALYCSDRGRYKLEHHHDRRDFDKAREIIRACCR